MQNPKVQVPKAFKFLSQPSRYKVAYGGRDGAKSWAFAITLLAMAAQKPLRILCTRELQSSIAESVYKVLKDQIVRIGLQSLFDVQKNIIRSKRGSEFIFKGLRMNITEIKSTEGVDICWVEEAQMVSDESWQVLIPTIRKPNSEIWISFNTGQADDPTYQRFVVNPPPDAIIKKVNYSENPWHSDVMEKERLYLQKVDPEAHDHIWLGNPLSISDACIFKGKFEMDIFEAPVGVQLFFGADFGFSSDPSTLVRSFIHGDRLHIEYEAYGVGVELDEMSEFYDAVPGVRKWPIMADNSRPETISYLKKKGSISSQPTSGPGQSKMESVSYESLKRLSSMSDASTPLRSSNYIPGRRTNRAAMSCPSLLMPITTPLTESGIPSLPISRPGVMPDLRIV